MLDVSKEDLFVLSLSTLKHHPGGRVEAIRRKLGLSPGDSLIEDLARELLFTYHVREFVDNLKDGDAVEYVIEDFIDAVEKDTGRRLKLSTIHQPDSDDE